MNSALKPVLPQPGVPQPGGQSSPAKANVAGVNHSVLPSGAQNHQTPAPSATPSATPTPAPAPSPAPAPTQNHGTNSLVGQNLTHHPPANATQAHAAPSMAPVTANMAQMAQNMSHHGNLSHVTQNSVAPVNTAASPSKSATTSSPLSLVQDKPPTPSASLSQPLALTRTPDKKDEPGNHANGTIDSPKAAANAPAALKALNPEPNKEKQDIAKTSPSTPKPPEKPSIAPNTPQKTEAANAVGQADCPAQAKVVPASNELPEKSPAKPVEPKPAPTADVAPSQSDNKPAPEAAKASQLQEKVVSPQKPAPTPNTPESAKTEPPKVEEKKEEPKPEKPVTNAVEEKKEEAKPETVDGPKKAEPTPEPAKPQDKVEEKEKKVETVKTPAKSEPKAAKPTLKLATVTTPVRKRRQATPSKTEGAPPAKKAADGNSTPDSRMKRSRTQVQLYQCPTPELAMATKLSAASGRSTPQAKPSQDDKLIVFYKNEYLAVRNAEGGFYVCQAVQNVYRNTRKIKIRWLSQDKAADPSGETYKPDFYDVTDMECVLTTLSMSRAAGGHGAQLLKGAERARACSILQRALEAETGAKGNIELTEEHPDGLDLSLYKDESQLEKKSRKRKGAKSSPRGKTSDDSDSDSEVVTPNKKARTMPKRSPKSARKPKPSPKPPTNKRKSAGSTPQVATPSKTATAVTEKAKPKATPKRTPAKPTKVETPKPAPAATPKAKGRRATREVKPSPIVATPSTSTGKTTRTPRKPPAKK